MHWSGTTRS